MGTSDASASTGDRPDLQALIGLFYDPAGGFGVVRGVESADVPPPYRDLLAHHNHMTVAVEGFFHSRVDVWVLGESQDDPFYARKILLTRQSDGQVVQFGIVRLDMTLLSDMVREEVFSRAVPLGRIFIRHNVLRQVELSGLWEIAPGEDLQKQFGLFAPVPCYGRTALIYYESHPVVELLEILAPIVSS